MSGPLSLCFIRNKLTDYINFLVDMMVSLVDMMSLGSKPPGDIRGNGP